MTKTQNTGLAFRLLGAFPFWVSLMLPPLVAFSAMVGGLSLLIVPLTAWVLFGALDAAIGHSKKNADPDIKDRALFWYRLVTLIWPPLQLGMIFGALYYVSRTDHLPIWQEFSLFLGIGVVSGMIGINYAHELMHQKPAFERALADILLASVLYSHFRSEHLLVHHRYVGTPRDPVTARYNESFRMFFRRVLVQCWRSAFRAEAERQTKRGNPALHKSNPFWRYWLLQGAMIILAFVLAGPLGVILFLYQSFFAIALLEIINYVEHYGLTRAHLGEGKYEHVKPHHSWNASHKASNWLLINLQRHSDHHYKPDRRFPLLQNYEAHEAPQLPYSYPVMSAMALIPRVWRRVMNPRVDAWRHQFYPEIEDWSSYNKGRTPMPR